MTARKLPPYHELRRLIVDQRKTYYEVGQMYGATSRAVSMTFRHDVLANGDTWPVLSRTQINERIKSGSKPVRISSMMIRGALDDAVEELRAEFPGKSLTWLLDQLSYETGVSTATLRELVNRDPHTDNIRRTTAIKILRGLGEDPHPSLLAWKPKNPHHLSSRSWVKLRARVEQLQGQDLMEEVS